jgi:uncharacterized ion transporter superfamily protein YfcC
VIINCSTHAILDSFTLFILTVLLIIVQYLLPTQSYEYREKKKKKKEIGEKIKYYSFRLLKFYERILILDE